MLCRGPGGALVVQRLEVLGERGVLDGEAERLAVRVDVVDDLPATTANTSSGKGLWMLLIFEAESGFVSGRGTRTGSMLWYMALEF